MNNKNNIVEQVRTRADIAAIIGRYTPLKSRGSGMVGLCPFHKEKTPSFSVNPAVGVYYCFGCGKKGNVFTFIQDMEGVGFRDALVMLADEVGIELPKYEKYQDRYGQSSNQSNNAAQNFAESKSIKTELYEIHEVAAKFFYAQIKNHPQAIEFFKSRGLLAETVKNFQLGYAPDSWTMLYDRLLAAGFSKQRIIESGLVTHKEGGNVYDRFRDRAIFPLYDLSGRVCAFAGRAMTNEAQPKYLNSPETALYQKSKILYGLHLAREKIRDAGHLLVVEGYMDHLTLYQAGVINVVAVSGTAFTEDHAHLITRFTKKVTLVFDGDRAGVAAARRAAFVLAPFDLQVSILALPADDDPDTFVKREGSEKFLALANAAPLAQDFLINGMTADASSTPHEKSRAADELMPYARALKDNIVRDDFLERIARRLRLDTKRITEKFTTYSRTNPVRDMREYSHDNIVGSLLPEYEEPTLGKLEEDFLRLLITDPSLIVAARQHIAPTNLTNALAADVYSIILDVYEKSGDLKKLPEAIFGRGAIEDVLFMLMTRPALTENIQDELTQKILLLHKKYVKARMEILREELLHVGDDEEKKKEILELIKNCGEEIQYCNTSF